MNKAELRQLIRSKSDALSGEYIKASGQLIAKKFIASSVFQESENIFIYVSTAKEPDTLGIIEAALASGKKVYVPKCGRNHTMKAIRINSTDELKSGYMGIPEPVGDEEAENIDLAVIPCISASTDGKRLGHGAGFYDRFLAETDTKKVCLCFGRLLCDDIPMEKFDIKMDCVISE